MSETSIEIVNPVGVGESKQTGLARRKHGSLHGLRVGLLDNNKPNADKFLQFVGDLLKRRAGDIELVGAVQNEPDRGGLFARADCAL